MEAKPKNLRQAATWLLFGKPLEVFTSSAPIFSQLFDMSNQIQNNDKIDIVGLASQIKESIDAYRNIRGMRRFDRKKVRRSINLLIKRYNDTVKFQAIKPI